eukprot:TRINITY_DN15768_c0_g1_i1.p1 TRINITY_DN15768_c0_g1~~TRINITY_DN15768_c0_g1_i1.p1  ORF type:complete len:291 (+),score=66.67 TRINITY_DN15768_c0_g1_i1:45-917(+)
MDFRFLYRRLGIQTVELKIKAEELFRLSKVKCPGGLGQGEIGRTIICLDIASELGTEKVSRREAIAISGLNEKVYRQTLSKLQNILNIKPEVTIKELAVQYGCVRLVPLAEQVLKEYTIRFMKTVPEHQRPFLDLKRPVYSISAFVLAAKKNKIRVEKQQMLSNANVNQLDYAKISKEMLDLCFDIIGTKRKATEEEPTQDSRDASLFVDENTPETAAGSNSASYPTEKREMVRVRNLVRDRAARKDEEYEDWKKKILSSCKSSGDSTSEKDTNTAKRQRICETDEPLDH